MNKETLPWSCRMQKRLQGIGIAVHNPFRDECYDDFGCCTHDKRYWLRIAARHLPIRRTIEYKQTAPIGTPGRTFVKVCRTLLFNRLTITTKREKIWNRNLETV